MRIFYIFSITHFVSASNTSGFLGKRSLLKYFFCQSRLFGLGPYSIAESNLSIACIGSSMVTWISSFRSSRTIRCYHLSICDNLCIYFRLQFLDSSLRKYFQSGFLDVPLLFLLQFGCLSFTSFTLLFIFFRMLCHCWYVFFLPKRCLSSFLFFCV